MGLIPCSPLLGPVWTRGGVDDALCWAAGACLAVDGHRRCVYHACMTTRTIIDADGRVEIPREVREALSLAPGDPLEIESSGEEITLRPARPVPALQKELGLYVFRSGASVSADAAQRVIDRVREERADDYAP